MNLVDFEEKMNAFSFRQHQFFKAYLSTLHAKGFTAQDALNYIEQKMNQMSELEQTLSNHEDIRKLFPKCPECDIPMMLRYVTTPQGRANVNGWRSCWECEQCAYEQYNKDTVDEIILALVGTSKRKKSRAQRLGKTRGQSHEVSKL